MSIIDDLKKQKGLYLRLPCGDEVKASQVLLFDATKPLPPEAATLLEGLRAGLEAERADLAKRKKSIGKTEVAAKAVNIGKVVEKITTVLPGFTASPSDCRSLFEPIDLLVFEGLSAKGKVESIQFTEVKSGGAKLNSHQAQIRSAIEAGKVEFAVEDMEVKS